MVPVLVFLELVWLTGIAVFLAGYCGGAVLHLLQDSCTKTGIQWNFPFQDWKVTGQLTTTARPEDIRYQRGFLTVLGLGVAGMFFIPIMVASVSAYLFSLLGLVLAVLLWVVFAKGIAKCKVYPR